MTRFWQGNRAYRPTNHNPRPLPPHRHHYVLHHPASTTFTPLPSPPLPPQSPRPSPIIDNYRHHHQIVVPRSSTSATTYTNQHGDRLGEADGVAQVAAERPVLEQQRGDERERDAEERHEQVADGHVHDEQIGDRVHLRREHDHVAHQTVADQRYDEHDRVRQVDERLERGRPVGATVQLVHGFGAVPPRGHSGGDVPRCGRRLVVALRHGAAADVELAGGHLQQNGDVLYPST